MKTRWRISLVLISVCSCLASSGVFAAQSSANKPPANASFQSNKSKIKISRISPQGCVNTGSRITLTGKDLGNARNQSLYISDARPAVKLSTVQWTNSKITLTLPATLSIEKGKKFRLGIREKNKRNWSYQSAPMLILCRSASATLNAQASTSSKPPPQGSSSSSSDPTTGTPARSKPVNATIESRSATARLDEREPEPEDEPDFTTPEEPFDRSGSLMDRGLPEPPQVAVEVDKKSEPDFEVNQLVVLSANMQEAMQLANELRTLNLRVRSRKKLSNLGLVISIFKTPAGEDLSEIAEQVRSTNPKVWIDLNHHYELLAGSRKEIGPQMIKWPQSCSKPVKIGQLDTQVNLQHPVLDQQNIQQQSFRPKQSNAVVDGHGNAIASILVGKQTEKFPGGMFQSGELYSADIFWQKNDKKYTSTEWIIKGLDWLAGKQVGVINMSFGGRRNLLLELAISRLNKIGIQIVAAAGNSGKNSKPIYPAAFDKVIAVTAVDHKRKNYAKASQGDYIDFAAPGVAIWAAHSKTSFKYQQGTSFAAPYVTGLAAIMDYESLKSASIDLGSPGKDAVFGWGLIQFNQNCN